MSIDEHVNPERPRGLAAALVNAQREMPAVTRDSVNPHFGSTFMSLDHLIAATKPVLAKHDLTIVQLPTAVDGQPALRTTILHGASGESLGATMPLVLDGQNMQKFGSALTYARRYAWASALGICDEADDDGNAASAGEARNKSVQQGGKVSAGNGSPPPPADTPTGWVWPFGKYKGQTLDATPSEYLDWFLEKSDKEDIKQRIREHRAVEEFAAVGATLLDDDIPFAPTIDGLGN